MEKYSVRKDRTFPRLSWHCFMEAGESPIFIKEVTVAIVTRQQKYPPLLLILLITSSLLLQSSPDGSDGAGWSLSRMEHPHWAMSSH